MTAKQLESLVGSVKKPNLLESEIKLLLNKDDANIKPIPKPQLVAQPHTKLVAQLKSQEVAQLKPKVVAQKVAQVPWVAQVVTKKVAQSKSKVVAQDRPQMVAQPKSKPVTQSRGQSNILRVKNADELLIDKYVNGLKSQISIIQGVEEKKRFIRDIGWGVMGEKRGRKYYLFGAKKISGRKYKLYIGNATN